MTRGAGMLDGLQPLVLHHVSLRQKSIFVFVIDQQRAANYV